MGPILWTTAEGPSMRSFRLSLRLPRKETTDTDESEFRPALAARDGKEYVPDAVPDGFYTVS